MMKEDITSEHPGFITRPELARRLGVTVHEIRRREARGSIQAAKRIGRTPLYTEDQAHDLRTTTRRMVKSRTTYSAEDAHRVFQLMEEKKVLHQIVLETKLHPLSVQAIASAYEEMSGGLFIDRMGMDKINSLTLDGNFPIDNWEDLVEVLQSCAESRCANCKKRPKVVCHHCVPALAKKLEL